MRRASRIPLAAASMALAAAPAIVRAQVAPAEIRAEPPIELSPPDPIDGPRDALAWAATLAARIAERQRVGPRDAFDVAPRVNGPEASPWMPDVRTGAPPEGQLVRPVGFARVELAPMPFEPPNTQVASARGSDGMFVGVQLRLPLPYP